MATLTAALRSILRFCVNVDRFGIRVSAQEWATVGDTRILVAPVLVAPVTVVLVLPVLTEVVTEAECEVGKVHNAWHCLRGTSLITTVFSGIPWLEISGLGALQDVIQYFEGGIVTTVTPSTCYNECEFDVLEAAYEEAILALYRA